MITGLDHVVVLLGDIEAGVKAYELLLGRAPSWRSERDGAETVLFTLDNMSLELMAPKGSSETADRIRSAIKSSGEGLASLCFGVGDIAKMHRRLDRVALQPDAVAEVESRDSGSGASLHWKRRSIANVCGTIRSCSVRNRCDRLISRHSMQPSRTKACALRRT